VILESVGWYGSGVLFIFHLSGGSRVSVSLVFTLSLVFKILLAGILLPEYPQLAACKTIEELYGHSYRA
jgi:hypothetical protein